MATSDKVIQVITTLVDANLLFPPKDIAATARVWLRLLDNVPDDDLEQAALDWISLEHKFPTIADMREMAHKVHVHNGASVAGDQFHAAESKRVYVPGIFMVGQDGWRPWQPGDVEVPAEDA